MVVFEGWPAMKYRVVWRSVRAAAVLPVALLCAALLLAPAVRASEAPTPRTVTLSTTEFPPYCGAALPGGGTSTRIVTEAFQRAGYAVEIRWLPWARALDYGKAGTVDGVLCIWHAPEREAFFLYSAPLPGNEIGFFRRRDRPVQYQSLSDLRGLRIGIVRGYANPTAFNAAALPTEEAVDDLTNLRKLVAGRIDLALIDRGVALHLIDTELPAQRGQLLWLGPPIDAPPLYVAFSRRAADAAALRRDFDAGLHAMARDGTLARLVARSGMGPAADAKRASDPRLR